MKRDHDYQAVPVRERGGLITAYETAPGGNSHWIPPCAAGTLLPAGLAAYPAGTPGEACAPGSCAALQDTLGPALAKAEEALARVSDVHAQLMDFTNRYRECLREERCDDIRVLRGPDQIMTAIHEFVAPARQGIQAMLSWELAGEPVMRAGEAALRSVAQARIRVLCPEPRQADVRARGWLERLAAAGADARVAPSLPAAFLVVDERLALVVDGQRLPQDGRYAHLIGNDALIDVLLGLFEGGWRAGRPVGGTRLGRPAGGGLAEAERHLLTQLAEGYKDDTIARRANVSVRTVRRMVARLSRRAGVSSRFALALEARRRGWLPEEEPW